MLEYTEKWAKGDSAQGKYMMEIGAVVLIMLVFILRDDNPLLRGALIPLGLIVLILLGYGGFLTFGRPAHLKRVIREYETSPDQVKAKELAKAATDHRAYTRFKKIWPVLIFLSGVGYFLVSTEYYKGLCLGLAVLFLSVLILDITLHKRLTPYYEHLKSN